MGMNVTIDTDGRSADVTSGDELTSPNDQDIDTSLKRSCVLMSISLKQSS